MDEPVIQIQDLCFKRGSRVIFKQLDMDVRQGQVVAIMGPSGTGKTTLLNLIGGQLKPQSGRVLLAGEEVATLSREQLYRLRRRIGVLFQEGGLLTDLNVFDNVAFPLRQHTQDSEAEISEKVLAILQAVGLRHAATLKTHQLSGGMARRVALARAIVLKPEILLYDEPFAGQDPIGRGVLLRLIRELNDTLHLTSVVVSHDVREAAEIADYVYIIHEGRVIGEGEPQALFESKVPAVYQFVHGLAEGPMEDYAA